MAKIINIRVQKSTTEKGELLLQKKFADCIATGIINIIKKAPVSSRIEIYENLIENIKKGLFN
ncbi:hypothetical protein [Anaerovorax odorimutans]|uniref:hypothetical protein n=1 Tax=Anaerovorax odorimutans TaxID=109327 RepID=UPI000406D278|nr:hypothetical protein [Anaerovorax odorimutans]